MKNGRKWISIIVILQFGLVACGASKEEMAAYYNALNQNNAALIKSIESQSKANQAARTSQFSSYLTAMNKAAMTPEATDDVAIALAFGYQAATPFKVEQPQLQHVKEPETGTEQIRAWTPLIGMALPFIYPWIYNSSGGGGSGTKVSADNGASVVMDSGNPGSYNKVGGDYSLQNSQSDYSIIRDGDNCADCGEDEFDDPGVCADNPPGGYNANGTPLQCEGCSCSSYAAGNCACVELY